MEITSKLHERGNQTLMNSPRNNLTNNTIGLKIPTPPHTPKTNIPRSDSNPYPTTFVQANTSTFKQVVQMLTGSSHTTKPSSSSSKPHPQETYRNFNIPPIKTTQKKQQGFKLYERRNNNNNIKNNNNLMINTLKPNFTHNNNQEILSPSLLDFPSLAISPVTPLNIDDPFDKSSSPSLGSSSSLEEEKAIAEKGFYLHPSPMSTPRDLEPRLLPLFPITSPRVSESPS